MHKLPYNWTKHLLSFILTKVTHLSHFNEYNILKTFIRKFLVSHIKRLECTNYLENIPTLNGFIGIKLQGPIFRYNENIEKTQWYRDNPVQTLESIVYFANFYSGSTFNIQLTHATGTQTCIKQCDRRQLLWIYINTYDWNICNNLILKINIVLNYTLFWL